MIIADRIDKYELQYWVHDHKLRNRVLNSRVDSCEKNKSAHWRVKGGPHHAKAVVLFFFLCLFLAELQTKITMYGLRIVCFLLLNAFLGGNIQKLRWQKEVGHGGSGIYEMVSAIVHKVLYSKNQGVGRGWSNLVNAFRCIPMSYEICNLLEGPDSVCYGSLLVSEVPDTSSITGSGSLVNLHLEMVGTEFTMIFQL